MALHHTALLCADVERTVQFYQGVLGFPLTEMVGNRDYEGSTHFFFDIGNGNLLAFFDFPGWISGRTPRCWVDCTTWRSRSSRTGGAAQGEPTEHGVEFQEESGTSIYFRDPDGARIELISDPLGEMYGLKVL